MDGIVTEQVYVGRKNFEFARHDDIGEIVKDNIDIDAFGCLTRKMVFEGLADGIVFPDEGFQVNALLRGIDGSEHRVVQLASIVEELDFIFTNLYYFEVLMRESTLGLVSLASY